MKTTRKLAGLLTNRRFGTLGTGMILVLLLVCMRGAVGSTGSTAANRVLGQPDFFHNAANTVDQNSMNAGDHLAVDLSVTPNRIYVADEGNHRVLGYKDVTALVNGGPADLVIGQPDFFASSNLCNNGGRTAKSLCTPKGVAVDSAGNLYVADFSNSRVLAYTNPFAACSSFPCVGVPANRIFGQGGDFTSGSCNIGGTLPTAKTLCSPVGIALDAAGNLYVADNGNNRVLEYNMPLVNTTANTVFGQGTVFTTKDCNKGGISANSLCGPNGVALDSAGNLYVADNLNNRVLEYNTPLTNTTANTVFGQAGSFSANGCNTGGLRRR